MSMGKQTRDRQPLMWVTTADLAQCLGGAGLVKGKTIGIDATTLEANAALRSIVRRDSGESYEEFLTQLAKTSGIGTPRALQGRLVVLIAVLDAVAALTLDAIVGPRTSELSSNASETLNEWMHRSCLKPSLVLRTARDTVDVSNPP
jgi:hypothetical protein